MRRAAVVAVSLALLAGCRTSRFSLEDEAALGERAYAQVLAENRVIAAGADAARVERVATRLVDAARVSDPEVVSAFRWEAALLDDPETVNAFALPGGKMACYSGMVPVASDDVGLAVVMGHEIAHATQRHGTRAMRRRFGIAFLTLVLFAKAEDAEKLLVLFLSRLTSLEFSREDELEADRLGLAYMARAGYDPRAAVEFWTRMEELGGSSPPQFLSTHPSHGARIAQIESLLPEALAIYQASVPNSGAP